MCAYEVCVSLTHMLMSEARGQKNRCDVPIRTLDHPPRLLFLLLLLLICHTVITLSDRFLALATRLNSARERQRHSASEINSRVLLLPRFLRNQSGVWFGSFVANAGENSLRVCKRLVVRFWVTIFTPDFLCRVCMLSPCLRGFLSGYTNFLTHSIISK